MQKEQVIQAIETTPKGANIIVEWVRPCKTVKACADTITKAVRMVGRMGIDYDKLSAVQEKRESGELPAESQPLPWGKWAIFPFLIEHKGGFYLRLYNGTSDKVQPEVHFFRNGTEVAKSEVENVLLASEKQDRDGDCFTCKVENMTRIHNESEWLVMFAIPTMKAIGQEKIAVASVPAKVVATMQ